MRYIKREGKDGWIEIEREKEREKANSECDRDWEDHRSMDSGRMALDWIHNRVRDYNDLHEIKS